MVHPGSTRLTSHAHPDHSGGMAIVQKQGAVLFGQEDLRREMMPPGSPADATTGAMALPMVGEPWTSFR